MTKQEAIEAARLGNKVRHRYFDDKEWMTMEGNRFVFEDGVKCIPSEFWLNRDSPEWEIDWELFKEQ